MMLKFEILGIPFAQQSFRFTQQGRKYQPSRVTDHKEGIVWQIQSQLPQGFIPLKSKVRINRLLFCFPPLKSMNKKVIKTVEFWDNMGERFKDGMYRVYKTTKPDMDNLEKHLWDALKGIVFYDDALIVEKKDTAKIYSMKPRIIVEIEGE